MDEYPIAHEDSLAPMAVGSRRLIVKGEGKLEARGRDSHLVLRFNGARSVYRSFVIMNGDAGAGEWDSSGLYIGRNGWGQDADFSFQYTISIETGRARTGFGMSTFAHGNDRILGYTANGFWDNTHDAINRVDLWAVGGGQAVGTLTAYWE